MSELKVHKAYNRWIDEEMPTPNDDLICNEVYLKSEADRYIGELKDLNKALKHDALRDRDRIRHQKYKRCLAMAKLCRSEWAAAIFIPEKGGTDTQAALYMKWEKRWLELAKKYKE